MSLNAHKKKKKLQKKTFKAFCVGRVRLKSFPSLFRPILSYAGEVFFRLLIINRNSEVKQGAGNAARNILLFISDWNVNVCLSTRRVVLWRRIRKTGRGTTKPDARLQIKRGAATSKADYLPSASSVITQRVRNFVTVCKSFSRSVNSSGPRGKPGLRP